MKDVFVQKCWWFIWTHHDPPFHLIRCWLVLFVCFLFVRWALDKYGGSLAARSLARNCSLTLTFSFLPFFPHSSFLSVWPASYLTLLSEIILHYCLPKARLLYAMSKRGASASDLLIDILLPERNAGIWSQAQLRSHWILLCSCTQTLRVSFHCYLALFSWR